MAIVVLVLWLFHRKAAGFYLLVTSKPRPRPAPAASALRGPRLPPPKPAIASVGQAAPCGAGRFRDSGRFFAPTIRL